jgi:pimeloyl-ACP methyl ester carboxylesterase
MAALKWTEDDVDCGGVRLHVRRVVDDEAQPLLLLHGLGVSGVVWQAFARRLLPEYAAVAPDLRGHGDSDTPPAGYEPADYARDLALLIETLPGRRLPVVGHSLGALVAVPLASRRPDLVPAVVLVDPPFDATMTNRDVPEVYRLRQAEPEALERYLLETNPGGGRALAQVLAGLFRRASDAAYEAILAAPPGHPAAWPEAATIRQPVLVVQADPAFGGILGDEAARRFMERLPNGCLVKIEGATHAVHASQPERLAEALRSFLADLT